MQNIKLSYSILNAWASGEWEQAVSYYLGKDFPATAQMELGRLKHETWEKEIKRTKEIPQELGGGLLNKPVVEQKYSKIIPLSDEYQILLRGMPDLTDEKTIYEWKTGLTEPAGYIDSFQMAYYRLLLPKVELGIYKCFNPYTKEVKTGIRFLSNKDAEQALEHIITFGSEIIQYLEANKLVTNFKE